MTGEDAVSVAAAGDVGRASPLVGREDDMAGLRALAAGCRMVTLTGPRGIGKTSLLRALAAAMAGEFPDGAVLVDLGDLRQPALVAARVAEALGLCEEPGIPVAATLAAAVAGRRLLLALDDAGCVAAACARLCDLLLAGAPGLRVIAASGEPLRAAAERAWLVPPLAVPAAGPAGAAGSPSLAVLTGAGLDPGEDDAGEAGALCRALGGVPLALELAGARLPAAGAGPARSAIEARLGLHGGPGAPGAVLEAVLEWTCGLLEPGGLVLLRRLSAFAGWSAEMADQLCAGGELAAARVGRLQSALASAGLVTGDRAAGPGRYRMPGAVRDFAARLLEEAGETAMMRRRLRDYVTGLAGRAATIGTSWVPATWSVLPDVRTGFDAPNFRAVLDWCLEHGDAEAGLRICTTLRLAWLVRDAWDERAWWLDALAGAAGGAVPPDVLGPALVARAQLAFDAGDMPSAQERGLAGLELCRAAGDARFTVAALDVLARVAVRDGRPEEALRYSGEALDGAPGDPWAGALPMGSRAIALAAVGRLPESAEVARAGLALMEQVDNQWGVAVFQLGLGNLARSLGDLRTARRCYEAALPFVRQSMGAAKTARCLAYLGRVAMRQADARSAREYLAESLRLSQDCGSRAGTARALRGLAAMDLREGLLRRAVQLGAAVTALCDAAGLPPPPEPPQLYLDAATSLGDPEATRLWDAGLALSPRAAAALALQSAVRPAW